MSLPVEQLVLICSLLFSYEKQALLFVSAQKNYNKHQIQELNFDRNYHHKVKTSTKSKLLKLDKQK